VGGWGGGGGGGGGRGGGGGGRPSYGVCGEREKGRRRGGSGGERPRYVMGGQSGVLTHFIAIEPHLNPPLKSQQAFKHLGLQTHVESIAQWIGTFHKA